MDTNDRRKRAGSEAADWFARLESGVMERAEREQFVEWLRESHVHVAEMLRIAKIHGALERFERWARISTGPKTDADNVVQLPTSPEDDSPPRPSPSRAQRGGYGMRILAAAAVAAVMVVVATTVVLPSIRGQIIETDRGERREVVLSDGSVLQVDPETRLRVKYVDEARRVFLERGRALFRVAKNPNRPFLVQADDTTVRAVGTVFGVEQQLQGVLVTVSEGKVAVFPTSQATVSAATPAPSEPSAPQQSGSASGQGSGVPERVRTRSDTLFLTANQQVTVAASGSAEPVQEVDSQRALAWAEGRLIFQNEELGRAVAEFNRYNRVQISVTDPALAARPVSGVFNATDPEAFIAFLQSVTAVQVARDGDRSISIGSPQAR